MKKLFVILILSFTWFEALDLDEMINQQEYEKMSPAECDILLSDNTKIYICSDTGVGVFSDYSDKYILIENNFYSSYIEFIRSKLDAKDRKEFEKLIKDMVEVKQEMMEEAETSWNENIKLGHIPEGANPINLTTNIGEAEDEAYLQYFKKMTNFIYDNPKYKYIFDEIFSTNPKEYYELINSDKEFLLSKIIKKAAQDNLIDKTGKLIAHTNELSKPSFDCAKAKSEVEKLICSNKETASLDKLYSKLYFGILNSIPKDTKLGQETRANLKTFNKNLLEYRDNMRCFFLDYNNDEKEVQETNEILGDNGVPLYAYLSIVRYGFKTQEQRQACVQRVYLMGILLLATNTLQDSADLIKGEYSDSEPYFLDIFSIKYLHNFELYDTFFPKEFKDKLSDITETLGYLSDTSRFSGHGYYYEEDTGFICTGGECDINTMKDEVEKPVKEFVKKIKF
ncbi:MULTISPECIES: hypothetical protein [unclassified Helicobacter]|uniref:hypothetical protein n=1 Tax=unclassified Helicobacter TaxID=2593540 RepID=UPI0015F19B91|nr:MULTISPECIES: hypothetical protein [unclassified Helicobacter]